MSFSAAGSARGRAVIQGIQGIEKIEGDEGVEGIEEIQRLEGIVVGKAPPHRCQRDAEACLRITRRGASCRRPAPA